jgi:hypothetical protein
MNKDVKNSFFLLFTHYFFQAVTLHSMNVDAIAATVWGADCKEAVWRFLEYVCHRQTEPMWPVSRKRLGFQGKFSCSMKAGQFCSHQILPAVAAG